MSEFSIIIIVLIGVIILIYQIVKRFILYLLTSAMSHKNYEKVIKISNNKLSNKALSEYVCDLFRIKAIAISKDEVDLKKEIDLDLLKSYSLEKKKEFLEVYYHHFLIKGDKDYALKLLSHIEELHDPKFLKYNKQAYEVIMNKRSDLISEMDEEIETDGYYGFPLGVVVYMIGMQYLYLDNKDNARTYFYNSLTCFHPKSVYIPLIKKHVDELTKEMHETDLNY